MVAMKIRAIGNRDKPLAIMLHIVVLFVFAQILGACAAEDAQGLLCGDRDKGRRTRQTKNDRLVALETRKEAHGFDHAPACPSGQVPWPGMVVLGALAVRRRDEDLVRGEGVDVGWTCAEGVGAASKWVQIAVEGEWKGHPAGPFALNAATFEAMVRNFRAGGRDLVVDYEHAGSIPGLEAPAAGWISGLRVGRSEAQLATLEAKVRWTDRARSQIAAGEYRYLSPGFALAAKDKKTGRGIGGRLTHVALTNRPFLDDLPPVTLTEGPPTQETEMELKIIAKALGISEDATEEQVLARIGEAVASDKALKDVTAALDLAEGATAQAAVRRALELRNPTNQATAAEVRELRERLAKRDAHEAVERALTEGKVTAPGTPQHTWAAEYALKDPEGFAAWAESAPVVVPVVPVQRPRHPQDAATGLTEHQRRMCEELGLTEDEYKAELRA